jgi:alkylated DNA repair dioxygenase AlkB
MLIPFPENPTGNLLPYDGIALYHRNVFSYEECPQYYNELLEKIAWQHDELIMFGKQIITKRKVAWYGDLPFVYTYSHRAKSALAWNDTLLRLKSKAEEVSGATFNSCLLNLYHDGQEGMSWHSDDEDTLIPEAAIASLSFGAERKFSFKHKENKSSHSLILENGSLLVMNSEVQQKWLHSLPKSTRVITPRINLTFRSMRLDSVKK